VYFFQFFKTKNVKQLIICAQQFNYIARQASGK